MPGHYLQPHVCLHHGVTHQSQLGKKCTSNVLKLNAFNWSAICMMKLNVAMANSRTMERGLIRRCRPGSSLLWCQPTSRADAKYITGITPWMSITPFHHHAGWWHRLKGAYKISAELIGVFRVKSVVDGSGEWYTLGKSYYSLYYGVLRAVNSWLGRRPNPA